MGVEEEKLRVMALAVHVVAAMVEYAVVTAMKYMEIMGDDVITDQVRHGCISILSQLDAIQSAAILQDSRKRKRKMKFLARKRLMDLDRYVMPRVTGRENYQRLFKMDPGTFQWLCEQVGPFVEKANTNYKKSISVTKRVAVALFRLATGANYSTAAEKFSVGESTVFYFTTELCQILCTRFKHMVTYPKGDALKEAMAGFESLSGLPNCVGAIGCMELRIKRPAGSDRINYVNKDEVHTIVTQVAVDTKTRVLSLATGYTGSVNNSQVLRASSLYAYVQSGKYFNVPSAVVEGVQICPYLVGSSTYQLLPWLMVPYPGEELAVFEALFNNRQRQMCQTLDKTFAALKSWGIFKGVMQVDVPTAVHMIGAVSVIHNMLLSRLFPADSRLQQEDFMIHTSRLNEHVSGFSKDDIAGPSEHADAMRDALATHLITM